MVPAAQQCAQLAAAQAELPWVRAGEDITDCTRESGGKYCVRCNGTAGGAPAPAWPLGTHVLVN